MSPMWSACRCDKKTFVVDSTGSERAVKFARDPEPRSKKKRSRSGFPTSISSDPDAWLRRIHGSPLPSTVTRISPVARSSVPGTNTSGLAWTGSPTTGVVVRAWVPPR
jgi:hypothetical protein